VVEALGLADFVSGVLQIQFTGSPKKCQCNRFYVAASSSPHESSQGAQHMLQCCAVQGIKYA
jgi:hypothetical protein